MEKHEGEFLTVPGFVSFMNRREQVVTREFTYRAIKRGIIPHYKINRKIFVRVDEALAALRQGASK